MLNLIATETLRLAPVAIGAFWVLRTLRYPDIGLPFTFTFGGAVLVWAMHHFSPGIAILISVGAGIVPALLNGILYIGLRLNPLLSGLLVGQVLYGVCVLLADPTVSISLALPSEVSSGIYIGSCLVLAGVYVNTRCGFRAIFASYSPLLVKKLGVSPTGPCVLHLILCYCVATGAGAVYVLHQKTYSNEAFISILMTCIVILIYGVFIERVCAWAMAVAKMNASVVVSCRYRILGQLSAVVAGTMLERATYVLSLQVEQVPGIFSHSVSVSIVAVIMFVLLKKFDARSPGDEWTFHQEWLT